MKLKKVINILKKGIDETMSIDHTTHSIFGASKMQQIC